MVSRSLSDIPEGRRAFQWSLARGGGTGIAADQKTHINIIANGINTLIYN